MSKGGYSKLLGRLQETSAANQKLRGDISERDKRISELETSAVREGKLDSMLPKPSLSFMERILEAIESPFVQTPVSVVGGIVGLFVYGPVLILCSLSVFAGVYRSGQLNGLTPKRKIVAWLTVAIVTIGVFAWVGVVIDRHRDHLPTLAEIVAAFRQENKGSMIKQPPSPETLPHPDSNAPKRVIRHTLSNKETDLFKKPLVEETEDRPQIHLACPTADESACVYAAQFIQIFRDAGWTVPEGIVERQTLAIPYDGIRIFEHIDTHADLSDPRGNFEWMAITHPMVAIYDSFSAIGILSDVGHGDTLPKDSLTIYFGPPRQDESAPTEFSRGVQKVKYEWSHNPAFKQHSQ